jgi:DNA repair protein RadA/Sms
MASKVRFICQGCGFNSSRWLGRCPGCGEWNTLIEESAHAFSPKQKNTVVRAMQINDIPPAGVDRFVTGISELDRVLGGGIVPGSLLLLGGDPGIGKSTLLLQMAGLVSGSGKKVLYASGEESAHQIKMRASRLGLSDGTVYLLAENDIETIEGCIRELKPDLVVLDSIQAVYKPDLPSAPGGVGQVRECAAQMMRLAKTGGVSIFLVGHVTKEGTLAGPRVLEHMVDAVVYFEGEANYSYRILRGVKNRFGSTSEIGIFQMEGGGLVEVANPSQLFLSSHSGGNVAGSVVIPTVEGSRTLLVEVQALVCSSGFGTPRRMTAGVDYNRVALIMAVLEKRAGLNLGGQDAYVNAVGGAKLFEPAVDLGIALALASGFREVPVSENLVAIGEIGLTGEIRPVSWLEKRIVEAVRLGYKNCLVPKQRLTADLAEVHGVNIYTAGTLAEAIEIAL